MADRGHIIETLQSLANDCGMPSAAMILKHGRWWNTGPFPDGVPAGKPKQCFFNSQYYLLTVRDRVGVTYVEGYAMHKSTSFPIHHGWVVDSGGSVIDLTWKDEGVCYFGVPFNSDYVSRMAGETGGLWSLFDNHHNQYALVRGLHTPEEAFQL